MGCRSPIKVLAVIAFLVRNCRSEVSFVEGNPKIYFASKRTRTIPPFTGQYYCFHNRVSCVEYEYSADGNIMSFVALERDILNLELAFPVRELNSSSHSVRVGSKNEASLRSSFATDIYCVVFINGNFDNPKFSVLTNSSTVHIDFAIEGCPTKYQNLMAIVLPVGSMFLAGICLLAMKLAWSKREKAKQLQQKSEFNQQALPDSHYQNHQSQIIPGVTNQHPMHMQNYASQYSGHPQSLDAQAIPIQYAAGGSVNPAYNLAIGSPQAGNDPHNFRQSMTVPAYGNLPARSVGNQINGSVV